MLREITPVLFSHRFIWSLKYKTILFEIHQISIWRYNRVMPPSRKHIQTLRLVRQGIYPPRIAMHFVG